MPKPRPTTCWLTDLPGQWLILFLDPRLTTQARPLLPDRLRTLFTTYPALPAALREHQQTYGNHPAAWPHLHLITVPITAPSTNRPAPDLLLRQIPLLLSHVTTHHITAAQLEWPALEENPETWETHLAPLRTLVPSFIHLTPPRTAQRSASRRGRAPRAS